MRSMNILVVALLLPTMHFGQDRERARTIAFLYFENNSIVDHDKLQPLSKGLADLFITEFASLKSFDVVERAKLESLLQEMALGQSGLVEESSASEVGKMLGAQYLVFGSFMNLYKNQFRIDVRIVNVETGLTLKAEEETGKLKDLSKLIARLSAKIIRNLNVKISKDEALGLVSPENESFEATLLYSRGLEYEDQQDYQNARKMYEQALKMNRNFSMAQKRLDALKSKI